jgi:uncharacterized protein (TIGR03435 family)
MLRTTSALLFLTSTAFCQSQEASPTFDVASVRAGQGGRGMDILHQNILPTPDSLTMRSITLTSSLAWAYHVMDYQVTGPDWMQSERYNIVAKSAGAVTEDQLRLMLQALLKERFKVEFHRQTKELPAYVLTVAKGGPKFHESQGEGEINIQPDQKKMSLAVQRASMSHLVKGLYEVFHAPIIDMTGLKGQYDITIDVAKYIGDMQPSTGGAPPDPIALITMGLQDALGLKIESKKVSLDLLVVDRAEKVPVEN